jgi:hypothetical protein
LQTSLHNWTSQTIEALRTPDERFANLPGWNYTPRYTDTLPGYEGLRMPTWTKEPLTLP